MRDGAYFLPDGAVMQDDGGSGAVRPLSDALGQEPVPLLRPPGEPAGYGGKLQRCARPSIAL